VFVRAAFSNLLKHLVMKTTSDNSAEFLKVRGHAYKAVISIVDLEKELKEAEEERTLQALIKRRHIKLRIKEIKNEERIRP
jgi:hypothetical protein